jgi:predicted alpha-1,6-mannanase (GH76 family)/lysophospholipase L1-like esterase
MKSGIKWVTLLMMVFFHMPCQAQTEDYSSQVNTEIVPWVQSVGKLFGLVPEALDIMGWNESYTTSCTAGAYKKMVSVVKNPAYYYCPTGYYRLKSDRGGYLYLEGDNLQTENYGSSRADRISSVVRLERMDDGGFYMKMQGRYLHTPLKDLKVRLGSVPDKFYPVVKVPGEKVAFTTKMGDYSALHCGYTTVIGYTLADEASYWTVSEAEGFDLPYTATKDGKYYATLYAPFATAPQGSAQAFTMKEQEGKAVAATRLDVVPDSTGVLVRSESEPIQFNIADNNHDNVPGNVVLSNPIADSSYYYFNKAFLLRSGEGMDNYTYYRTNLSTVSKLYFWQQALVILMVEDRYDFRGDKSVASLVADLLDAFSAHETAQNATPGNAESIYAHSHGLSDWTWNKFNDDLLWAGLAYIRGYLITREKRFLDQAKWTWDLMYNRGWDEALDGGIWWSTDKREKSGLSNNPAICMASYLYEATGDETYLNRAKEIYNWVKAKLRRADGAVSEKMDLNGIAVSAYNVYNQGTFIEGASLLWKLTGETKYRTDARKTLEYVMINQVDNKGIMSRWKVDGTWQSEFARGVATLMKVDPEEWKHYGVFTKNRIKTTYYRWMRRNADAAWETRDRVNNITGCEWSKITPTYPSIGETWEADACASAVVMTNVVPAVMPGSEGESYATIDDHSEDYVSDVDDEADTEPFKLDEDGIMRVNTPINIVCVGNSITEGYGNSSSYMAWPAQMGRLLGPKYSVLNCGVSGTTMGTESGVSYWDTGRYATAKAANPQILIMALGTNDADPWRWDQWGGAFKQHYLDMIEEFRADGRNPIIFCTLAPPIFPVASSRQNSYIEEKLIPIVRNIAGELNAYLIDFHSTMRNSPEAFPDNVHPNDGGAALLADIAAKRLLSVQTLKGMITVDDGTVVDSTVAVVNKGSAVTLTPISGKNGSWLWKGPEGFTSTDRVLQLTNVQQGGTYNVEFTDEEQHRSLINFLVSVKGETAGTLTPYLKATNGDWVQSSELTVRPGYTVEFAPQMAEDKEGTWVWKGPNGFTAFSKVASVSSMNNLRAGRYAVTFTDKSGRQSTCVYNLKVDGDVYCQDLVPYVKYGSDWQKITSVSMAAGESVTFGPQPMDGEWSWTGPDGFTSNNREARINNFSAAKAGEYIGTRTTDAGCFDQIIIKLTLK